jgi:hypothetical protein
VKRAIVLLALAPACSWASFDNLAGETWVDSSGPPKGADTTKFGANLAAGGARPAAGGMQMLVVGRANPDVSRLAYDGNGIVTQSDGGDILTTLQFTKFDDLHPATVGDPGSNAVAVALVTRGGATSMDKDANTKVVFYGTNPDGPNLLRQHEPGPDLKAAKIASGMVFGEVDGAPTHPDLLIARDDQVMIMTDAEDDESASTMFRITACTHNEKTSYAIGLGDFDSSTAGPEIVLSTGSPIGDLNPGISKIKIFSPAAVLAYTGGPVQTCFMNGFSAKEFDKSSENVIDLGEQLLVTDFGTTAAPLPAIVASAPAENKLFVFTGDIATAPLAEIDIPAPAGAGALGSSLAVGDLDGDGIPELAVGDPKATSSDGVQDAGSVFVYKWNGTTFDLVATLRDAQPDIEQHFGTSVAIVPFGTGTENVLVAGSDDEVFTYFRLDPLYKDVRAGHQ